MKPASKPLNRLTPCTEYPMLLSRGMAEGAVERGSVVEAQRGVGAPRDERTPSIVPYCHLGQLLVVMVPEKMPLE